MALQSSGSISFSQIANEFGTPPGKNLGAYRISQSVAGLSNLALDNEVNNVGIITAIMPQSGTIRFSDFYNKRLNIVVNCGSGSRITARSRYDDNSDITVIGVIGGLRSKPDSSAGRKVWIHTNETIKSNIAASSAPNREYSSLITGGWESNTNLRLDIGPNGVVIGAGGNGGAGANASKRCNIGNPGRFGTSAIAANYQPIIITNRGRVQGGTGGGGGGGSAYSENRRTFGDHVSITAGGGGGGGSGSPGGAGGAAGTGTGGKRTSTQRKATDGTIGTDTNQGQGGVGAIRTASRSRAYSQGGNGGDGGSNGGSGSGNGCGSPGGSAGASGFSIIITNDGTGVSIINRGTQIGITTYNTSIS